MMYSLFLVLAVAAQGYARPNCFFSCDYPVGQAPSPSFPGGNIVQHPGYPGNNFVQPGYPSGGIVQSPSIVDTFNPVYQPPRQPSHIENFQPSSGSHLSFNHESQSSQKTSISGTYHYPAPSPPMNEPIYQQPPRYQPIQKPCRIYSDCS